MLLCLRGTIFLYQGDELGLPQAHVPFEKLQDPEGIRFWPEALGRDGARTPMPWNASGGFSASAETWLPMDPRHIALNAEAQSNDATSLWAFTHNLIALRKAHPALRLGEWKALQTPNSVLAFEREGDDERVVCVFNLSAADITFPLAQMENAKALDSGLSGSISGDHVTLPAHGGVIALAAR